MNKQRFRDLLRSGLAKIDAAENLKDLLAAMACLEGDLHHERQKHARGEK